MTIVTQERLISLLNGPKQIEVLGRALVHIFNRQTTSEQQSLATKHDNGIGFTGGDAYSGSLTAKSFLKNGTLADWQVDKWMKPNAHGIPRIAKYWRQIDEEAQKIAEKGKVS